MRPLQLHFCLLLCCAAAALAQEAAEPPCSAPEFRELDFWVGDWSLRWTNSDGSIGRGQNRITSNEYGDCVIYERFSAPQLNGMSVSTYHAPTGLWRQSWVDDSGGYFALTGGPPTDPGVRMELRNTRLSDDAPHLRMIWEDVTADSLTWRWQSLPADADPERDTWGDSWVIEYRRND